MHHRIRFALSAPDFMESTGGGSCFLSEDTILTNSEIFDINVGSFQEPNEDEKSSLKHQKIGAKQGGESEGEESGGDVEVEAKGPSDAAPSSSSGHPGVTKSDDSLKQK